VVPPSSNLARAKFSKLVSNVPLFKSAPHAKTPRAPVPRFSDTVLVSPDMGGIRRIRILSEMLNGMPYATIDKNRDLKSGKIEASKIHGVVKKKAIVVDDMISTGNTIVAAVDLLSKKGAEGIVVFATHPVFSKDAHILLQKSKVKKVFVTDTISVPKEKLFPKLEVLSVAGIIAQILMHPNRNTPNKSEY
jgi:ribose-phosphate pyrophosphokinase